MDGPPRVLIVDDDADTLRLYGIALELMGCNVVAVASGRDALRSASADRPNIVVTDLAMPGMDGIELCEALRAGEETRDIPIVAVSGQALGALPDKALAAGCSEVLLKPCAPEDLYSTIVRVLDEAMDARENARLASQMARELRVEAQRVRAETARIMEISRTAADAGVDRDAPAVTKVDGRRRKG